MKTEQMKKSIYYFIILSIIFSINTGCKTAKLIEYSSIADHEQNVSFRRTEMLIVKGDNEKISRNYAVVSAVDYLQDGKKIYYLFVVPVLAGGSKPKIEDLQLQYEYPYIIQSQNINDLITNLDKCINEWDSIDTKYSGAVYKFFISSPQNTHPWFNDNKVFEISPYTKLNYSKTENGAIARLALGNRIDEIINTSVDGKTVKNKVLFQENETFWIFETSEQIKDFHNLLTKGLLDLKEKGMDGYSKKIETKPEIKTEIKAEDKPVEVKKEKKQKKRKK